MSNRPKLREELQVFLVFFKLGSTSFGGPIAHLSYFHQEFVSKRKWIKEKDYQDRVALSQFLPGPSSSQVGMLIGKERAGIKGAFAAWLGFTLPSAILMMLLGGGIHRFSILQSEKVLHRLSWITAIVVAQAVLSMGKGLHRDFLRLMVALFSAMALIFFSNFWTQFLIVISSALFGMLFIKGAAAKAISHVPEGSSSRMWIGAWLLMFLGSIAIAFTGWPKVLTQPAALFKIGSLVLGGGHVVLPFLQTSWVNQGWMSSEMFQSGYGLVQALPGPLFTISAFLGMAQGFGAWRILNALLCLISIFLPGGLLALGVLPLWSSWKVNVKLQAAMKGVHASVVGILLASFVHPILTTAVRSLKDGVHVLIAFIFLQWFRVPAWAMVLVVLICSVFQPF